MAQLMPPVLADDLLLGNLMVSPELAVAVLVEVNSLEDVLIERHLFGELALVVCAVKAHFELGLVLGIHLDVVHGAVLGLCILQTRGLVGAVDIGDSQILAVEVLVVLLHVFRVVMGDGDVIAEFCRTQNLFLFPACGFAEDSLGCISKTAKHELIVCLFSNWRIWVSTGRVVMVWHWCSGLELHNYTFVVSLHNLGQLCRQADGDTA
ncbi:hypothetical protein HG530_005697 [Fusarium avenaceum]|nr:hypothetical protein HG530_005697 [Fusarium avenaceum]